MAGERGYPDTVRDVRGFAIKFYTEDGIWDIVGNNTPVFFVKDAAVFASFIHVMKRYSKNILVSFKTTLLNYALLYLNRKLF